MNICCQVIPFEMKLCGATQQLCIRYNCCLMQRFHGAGGLHLHPEPKPEARPFHVAELQQPRLMDRLRRIWSGVSWFLSALHTTISLLWDMYVQHIFATLLPHGQFILPLSMQVVK